MGFDKPWSEHFIPAILTTFITAFKISLQRQRILFVA